MEVKMSLDGNGSSTLSAKEKKFSTGSRGYYVFGKVAAKGGKRYQVICNLVEIGSKPEK